MYKIFLAVVKNFVAFIVGMILSIPAVSLFPGKSPLALLNNKDIGFAVIALLLVLFIYFSAVGLVGGVLGVIIYNLVRFFKERNLLKCLNAIR